MTELFTLESLSILATPHPKDLEEADPRRELIASVRQGKLLAEKDERNVDWLLAAVEFYYDTGAYSESIRFAKHAFSLLKSNDECAYARGLCFQCMNYLAIANGASADRCAARMAKLAAGSDDPFVAGTNSLLKGMNRQYNILHRKKRQLERGATFALPLFEHAARSFQAAGDPNFAIRTRLELGRAHFELGSFFRGIDELEIATEMVRKSGCWGSTSRIMLLLGSNASDMGYRAGVEEAIRKALAWADYLGDAWARIEALTVLGRFLYYTMPPGDPRLAQGPDEYLKLALRQAEALGVDRLLAAVDSTRYFLFRKAGDDKKVQELLGDASEEEEFRRKQQMESRQEIERIAEGRRRKTALRLHDGVEDSPDAFFVFDAFRDSEGKCRDFGWAYVNLAAHKIFDQSPSQIYLYSEARNIPQLSGLERALLHAVEDRQSYEDRHHVTIDESVWLQRRVVPSGDGAVITIRDVTAEKNIEAVLRHAAESARRSEGAKTAFLASMSHEIRTPLNGVLGLARMLSETDLSQSQRAFVDDIVFSGNILLDLIGDVLDLSKIEANQMQLSLGPVSLPNFVASVVNLFHGQAQEKATSLSFDIDSGVPESVLADSLRLRQILSNLIGNAVKFTEGGNVCVRVTAEKEMVVFEVQDTGIGISPEHIETVFDRFQQVNSSRGGTGLGLAISRALAELMGGTVTLKSVLGQGSTFSVRLPLEKAISHSLDRRLATPTRFGGFRALIVDDNQINLVVSSHAIEKFGCETVSVKDGYAALDALTQETFDIIFLDVQMPGFSGLEVTQEIRRREGERAHTPIVALTAGALLQEQQQCFAAGMDDFVTKPISLDAIQSILTKWLPTS